MNEFVALRKRAWEKRDKAIGLARAEYTDTLAKIAALEQDLLGKVHTSHRKISSAVESVIPTDRPFTTVDIMTALEALDSGRVWRKRSVDNHLFRLRDRGLVPRLRRAKKTEPGVYVRVGVEVDPLPFQDMTLPDVIAEILADGPLRQTELVVKMLEHGYETAMTPKSLRDAVGVELRKDRNRFRKDGECGEWAVGN